MPFTQMSTIAKSPDLIDLDTHVFTRSKQVLNGRSLFSSRASTKYKESYAFDALDVTGKATRAGSTGRSTSIPVGDETKERQFFPFTMWQFAIEYTDDQLGEANEANDTGFLARKGDQASRALAEYENKVIFNGIKEDNIIGLTQSKDKTGFQQHELSNKGGLEAMTPEQIKDYFKQASRKITKLGYSTQKPILLITSDIEDKLDVDYNQYSEKSIEDRISKYFSQIKVIPELEKQYTGRKSDMGIVMLNDSNTAEIIDAIRLERQWEYYEKGVHQIAYRQKSTGVVYRYPSHFVQLPMLLPPTSPKK